MNGLSQHFYMNFYVFSTPTSVSASVYFAADRGRIGPPERENT